jgi:hypothetical protein
MDESGYFSADHIERVVDRVRPRQKGKVQVREDIAEKKAAFTKPDPELRFGKAVNDTAQAYVRSLVQGYPPPLASYLT